MKKRFLTVLLAMVMCVSLCTMGASASSYTRVSKVSVNDGIWLFPVASNYYIFTDWAGCPGYGKCGLCGKIHERSWGDSYHENQAPLGHNGIDIGVKKVNVYASAAGTVAYTGYNSSRGNYVILEHPIAGTGYSYYSYYQHLEKIHVSKGTKVSAGETIALSGNTGVGSGYHLHFGIVMALAGTNISTRLYEIENKGWLTTDGYREGRILNNPSTTSQFPTGNKAVLAPLAAHSGSVSYTFDKSKVAIGGRTALSTTQSATPATVSISIGSGNYNPGTLKQGSYYSISGEVKSNYNLTSVTVGIYNSDGTATSYVRTVNPGKTSYNISGQDYYMMFNKLGAGTYYFKVTATASGTTKTLVNNKFTIQNPASTLSITPGKYNPGTLKQGSYYSIGGEITSNYNLTSVTVGIYNSNGTATSYVRTANPGKTSYNISAQDYYMMFNKLAVGTYYFKVMATDASGTTKTLVNNKFTIQNPASTLSIALGKYSPGTLKLGSYYSINGEIKSNYNLTSVTVGIYNSNGTATPYVRTANPGKMSYNISTQDYYMMFNKLAKGTYYFKVIATDASGTTKTLVNNQFTIK